MHDIGDFIQYASPVIVLVKIEDKFGFVREKHKRDMSFFFRDMEVAEHRFYEIQHAFEVAFAIHFDATRSINQEGDVYDASSLALDKKKHSRQTVVPKINLT